MKVKDTEIYVLMHITLLTSNLKTSKIMEKEILILSM